VHRYFGRFVDPDLAVQAMSPTRSVTRKRPPPRDLRKAICGRFMLCFARSGQDSDSPKCHLGSTLDKTLRRQQT
jgi:hypothetical protein